MLSDCNLLYRSAIRLWKKWVRSYSHGRVFLLTIVILIIAIPFMLRNCSNEFRANYKASPVYLRYVGFFRPLWGTPPKPFKYIVHFYGEDLSREQLCHLHGWKPRSTPRRVFDAILFGNEVDILEIRLQELKDEVYRFIIIESHTTFTGLTKKLYFEDNVERFSFAKNLIAHNSTLGHKLGKHEHAFHQEDEQRDAINRLLKANGIADGDLLIMSDVDEIPSKHTINLLKWCDGIPSILHLQLRNYLYSFEFPLDYGSWKSSAHVFQSGKTSYGSRERRTDVILADAGWHCSFCFRHIADLQFKIKAYSHADRLKYLPEVLDSTRIQEHVCNGVNLFDSFPQEYTFRDLIGKMGPPNPSYSAVNLPTWVLKNVERFSFLLPKNCVRH